MPDSIDEVRGTIITALPPPRPPRSDQPLPISSPATVYGRKLRRLMLAALEAPEPHRLREALFELTADASYVFCHQRSPAAARSAATRDLLSDEQYSAVVRFLTLVADGDFVLDRRYAAISGLRWLWTRLGVDQARIRAFYTPLHGYARPESPDAAAERMARQIEAAFLDTPHPVAITSAASDESCDVDMLFAGARWQSMHPDLIALEPAALSFFTDEAFRYFLPAYMVGDLVEAPIDADPVFHLTYNVMCKDDDKRQRAVDRFRLFSAAERAAIAAYLRASAVRRPHWTDDVARSLEVYWLPSLTGA